MKLFEEILELKNEQSRIVAWRAFAVMTVLCVVLAIAIMIMTPLKRTEVQLVVVDKNTGYPTEITKLADFQSGNTKQIQASEALNKYFVQHYITAHDSYNHFNVRDAYRTVQLWSSPDVFQDYAKLFTGANDIQKTVGAEQQLEVIIHSMNPLPQPTEFNGKENGGKMMQARIEKVLRKGDYIIKRATGTVTVSFGYDTHLRMDEESRNFNPLGFTVVAYQFVPDQRVEDFPVKDDFYPVNHPEKNSPKPDTAQQGGVSPVVAEQSGQAENLSPKEPETVAADENKGVPPAVTDNSGNLNTTQGQPKNPTRHSEPLGEESQNNQQDSSPALQVQNDGKEQGNNTQGESK